MKKLKDEIINWIREFFDGGACENFSKNSIQNSENSSLNLTKNSNTDFKKNENLTQNFDGISNENNQILSSNSSQILDKNSKILTQIFDKNSTQNSTKILAPNSGVLSFQNSVAVIGISGGKDSSVVAALCKNALGKDRVLGVLMPSGAQPDIDDARALVEFLGIRSIEVNIGEIFNVFKKTLEMTKFSKTLSNDTLINLPPRIRMTTLYAVAASLGVPARVANTSNASENFIGFSTKFGDHAGDFSPLGNILATEVVDLGKALGLPLNLVSKVPADGLTGLSDEARLGFSYEDLDSYILSGKCKDKKIEELIFKMHKNSRHKYSLMPTFERNFN